MFGIFPEGFAVRKYNELVLPSFIVIDHFKEVIDIPLSYWDFDSYKKNWLVSLEEGMTKKNHAALAVSMREPDFANLVFTWVLYFEGDVVYVQNKIIFLDECTCFNPEEINSFVGERVTYDEDGQEISEWKTDLVSVVEFYNSLK